MKKVITILIASLLASSLSLAAQPGPSRPVPYPNENRDSYTRRLIDDLFSRVGSIEQPLRRLGELETKKEKQESSSLSPNPYHFEDVIIDLQERVKTLEAELEKIRKAE